MSWPDGYKWSTWPLYLLLGAVVGDQNSHLVNRNFINVSVFACFKAFFIVFRGCLSENSDWQIGNLFTVRRQCPFYFHPPLLKIFKRDGVLIFESKIKAAVAQAPLFSQDFAGFYIWYLRLLDHTVLRTEGEFEVGMVGLGAEEKSLYFAAVGCCLRFDVKPIGLFCWDQSVWNSTRLGQQASANVRPRHISNEMHLLTLYARWKFWPVNQIFTL